MTQPAWKKFDTFTALCHTACAAVTVAIAAGSWYLAPCVLGAWRQSLDERTAAAAALVEQKPQIRAQHAAAAEKCAQAEAALARLKGRIPPKLDTSEFYRLVSRAAAAHGVELGDVRPQDHRRLGIFDKHKWRMTARGGFLNVCRFMKAVEELPIQCYVDDIAVNAGPAEDQNMMAELGIVGFSQRPEAPRPTTPPVAP